MSVGDRTHVTSNACVLYPETLVDIHAGACFPRFSGSPTFRNKKKWKRMSLTRVGRTIRHISIFVKTQDKSRIFQLFPVSEIFLDSKTLWILTHLFARDKNCGLHNNWFIYDEVTCYKFTIGRQNNRSSSRSFIECMRARLQTSNDSERWA